MLIGIDASRVTKNKKTGIENYSLELILNIAKIDFKNHYILHVKPDYDPILNSLPKNFRLKIINFKRYWTEIGLTLEMIKNPIDSLFIPAYGLPKISPKNSTITVHDLAWKYFPEAYSKKEISNQNRIIRRAIKKKANIIVYSKSTENDLKKFFQIDSKQIFFVPMGFSEKNLSRIDDGPLDVDGKYILYVGRLETKKNIKNLISAYALLRKERKIKHKLVLVGKQGFGYSEIKSEIEKTGELKQDIIETGFVDDKKLLRLYASASVFVFPSLYEGFGIPILEAFSAGVPVITSKVSSMPEVAGNSAILVDPKKTFEITAAISQIINKPEIARSLVLRGKKQLKNYSWTETAEKTIKVITST